LFHGRGEKKKNHTSTKPPYSLRHLGEATPRKKKGGGKKTPEKRRKKGIFPPYEKGKGEKRKKKMRIGNYSTNALGEKKKKKITHLFSASYFANWPIRKKKRVGKKKKRKKKDKRKPLVLSGKKKKRVKVRSAGYFVSFMGPRQKKKKGREGLVAKVFGSRGPLKCADDRFL